MNVQPLNSKTTPVANSTEENQVVKQEQRELTGSEKSQANKQQLNATIIQSQFELSLKSDNKSLNLLYKSVISSLATEFEDYLQKATEAGKTGEKVTNPYGTDTDTSPKATADRILTFATGFYDTFKKQNPNLSEEEGLEQFISKISAGIDQGFGEARDVLGSLKRLDGKVKTDIDETYELIQKGLSAFRDSFKQQPDDLVTTQPVKDATA